MLLLPMVACWCASNHQGWVVTGIYWTVSKWYSYLVVLDTESISFLSGNNPVISHPIRRVLVTLVLWESTEISTIPTMNQFELQYWRPAFVYPYFKNHSYVGSERISFNSTGNHKEAFTIVKVRSEALYNRKVTLKLQKWHERYKYYLNRVKSSHARRGVTSVLTCCFN